MFGTLESIVMEGIRQYLECRQFFLELLDELRIGSSFYITKGPFVQDFSLRAFDNPSIVLLKPTNGPSLDC